MTASNGRVVLVTGAMGCIGAWTLYHLVQRGERAVSFDLSENRSRLNLLLEPDQQNAITFLRGDLTRTEEVAAAVRDHSVTHIIHLAALQVPFCRANPVAGAQVNVVGTVNIFEAARQHGIRHLTQASSIAIYGTPDEYPPGMIRADAPPSPHTLYGVYKTATEGLARVYWADHLISSTTLRPYVVYGLGRDQGLTSEPTTAMLAAAAGKSSQISFNGRMQFQWASDVAQQFIDAAALPLGGAHAFNLGGPLVSVESLAAMIESARPGVTIRVETKPLPFAEGFDDAALKAHFPTVYETPLEAGVAATLAGFERALAAGRIAAP